MEKPTKQGFLSEHIYKVPDQTVEIGLYSVDELPELYYETEYFRGEKFVFFEGKGWKTETEDGPQDFFDDEWANEYLIGASKYHED